MVILAGKTRFTDVCDDSDTLAKDITDIFLIGNGFMFNWYILTQMMGNHTWKLIVITIIGMFAGLQVVLYGIDSDEDDLL